MNEVNGRSGGIRTHDPFTLSRGVNNRMSSTACIAAIYSDWDRSSGAETVVCKQRSMDSTIHLICSISEVEPKTAVVVGEP